MGKYGEKDFYDLLSTMTSWALLRLSKGREGNAKDRGWTIIQDVIQIGFQICRFNHFNHFHIIGNKATR